MICCNFCIRIEIQSTLFGNLKWNNVLEICIVRTEIQKAQKNIQKFNFVIRLCSLTRKGREKRSMLNGNLNSKNWGESDKNYWSLCHMTSSIIISTFIIFNSRLQDSTKCQCTKAHFPLNYYLCFGLSNMLLPEQELSVKIAYVNCV